MKKKVRPFAEAREYVRTLGFKKREEYRQWAQSTSSARPPDIPNRPDRSYKDSGWTTWAAFLGTDNINNYAKRGDERKVAVRSTNTVRAQQATRTRLAELKEAAEAADWYIMHPNDLFSHKEACVYIGGVDKGRMYRLKIPSPDGSYWRRRDLDKWLEETAPTNRIFNSFLTSRENIAW